jgi:predicted AlkP superfamily pyrophosphatase or phosphodiesterase
VPRWRTGSIGLWAALVWLGTIPPAASAQSPEARVPGAPLGAAAMPPAAKTVILLVFEGFSPALVAAAETPSFDRMREEGAWTHRVVASFPTTRWVNGASLATGCWPEHHGIVADRFLDPERGLFEAGPLRDWWTGCEALAPVAARQGLAVATLGWYGTEATEVATEPMETCSGATGKRDADRFARLLDVVARPAVERPRLILARFCTPGSESARYGVDTSEGIAAAERIDGWLGELHATIDQLEERESGAGIALIVTTDHGMRDVSHLIQLERILRREGVKARVEARGSTAFLYLDPGQDPAAIAERLAAYAPFEVLDRDEPPIYAHWGSGPRVAPLIVSAFPPYFIENRSAWPLWLRALAYIAPDYLWAELWRSATSGFVPRTPAMYGLLYAWGAGIVAGQEAQAMRVIDIHPTVVELLGIAPGEPLDGRAANSLFRARAQ